MKLIEPLGLLFGQAARDAVSSGLALAIGGGDVAFSLARLHGGGPPRIVPAGTIPDGFADALTRISNAPLAWAGLPTGRPLIMGIINVTPDSFSDGGDRLDHAAAIEAGLAMRAAGADVIDVGGESTRPGALGTDPALEQARVLPVIRALAAAGATVSVDTRRAATMAASLEAGAAIINDVSGLAFDPAAPALVRRTGAPVIVMHSRGAPDTMQSLTQYDDVAVDVTRELAERLGALGLAPGQAAVDPGIGFAKGPGQNEILLARLPLLLNLGCRIVVGASRKGFVGRVSGEAAPKARLPGSLAAALAALQGGAAMLRVHDVGETLQAVALWGAIQRS